MKTKREILELIAKQGNCGELKCSDCAFYAPCDKCRLRTNNKLEQIGAMAILRMFPKKKKPTLDIGTKIRFNSGDIATVVFLKKEYCLMFESHEEKLNYLIGKIWEVVEE